MLAEAPLSPQALAKIIATLSTYPLIRAKIVMMACKKEVLGPMGLTIGETMGGTMGDMSGATTGGTEGGHKARQLIMLRGGPQPGWQISRNE